MDQMQTTDIALWEVSHPKKNGRYSTLHALLRISTSTNFVFLIFNIL